MSHGAGLHGSKKLAKGLQMSSDIAVRVQNLSKCYQIYDTPRDRLKQMILPPVRSVFGLPSRQYSREFWALHDISFDIKKGEAVGIVGRNGAGKSTLLQLVCGTLAPTTGVMECNGRIAALLELGAGFNPEFTGCENIYMSGMVLGLTAKEITDRYDEIVSFAEIGEHVDQPVKTYSSGMFMRLAFSLATSVDPDILVIDEALSVGDAAFQMKCAKRIQAIREKGKSTFLFVSHSDYSVRTLCSKAIYLQNGRCIAYGNSDDVVALYNADLKMPESSNSDVSKNLKPLPVFNKSRPMSEKRYDYFSVVIKSAHLSDVDGNQISTIKSGDSVTLNFSYAIEGKLEDDISFVFNLYRRDGLYILGATTLMEDIEPFSPCPEGTISIHFPDMNLLSGFYKWRVAVNDSTGLTTLAEAKNICDFKVMDSFDAIGIVNLKRMWRVDNGAY